jgi:hypothetical protein
MPQSRRLASPTTRRYFAGGEAGGGQDGRLVAGGDGADARAVAHQLGGAGVESVRPVGQAG